LLRFTTKSNAIELLELLAGLGQLGPLLSPRASREAGMGGPALICDRLAPVGQELLFLKTGLAQMNNTQLSRFALLLIAGLLFFSGAPQTPRAQAQQANN